MNFFVIELSGRHYQFVDANDQTTVGDVRKFISTSMKIVELFESQQVKILLIHQGTLLTDDMMTLSSIGLTPETSERFRIHTIVKKLPPRELFDGNCHPFVINDLSIGGDIDEQTGEDTTPATTPSTYSLQTFLSKLQQTKTLSQEELALISTTSTEDRNEVTSLSALEQSEGFQLPKCLKEFFTFQGLPQLCCTHLALNPLIITHENRSIDWGAPLVIKPPLKCDNNEDHRKAMLFMMDHQGCCYWYAVWNNRDASAEDCEVYVLIGGEEFTWNETVFLTSKHFWRFLVDFLNV